MSTEALNKDQAKDIISRAVHPYLCKFHEAKNEDFDRFTVEMDDETQEFEIAPATWQNKSALIERLDMVRTRLVGRGGSIGDYTA
ncbi:hypothetical protein [Chromohalobacter sp. 11-W]|uniref:hypothetical protein n=1 Tax=Chromohalobacter sp. 11-W TaxID=2994061 RepID=UPI00045CBEB1|nr:hypothetical protein [Chromohalobacter sp. 11-W]CDQ34515.1 hypothetical protein BN993_03971 [Virgibacillus halodenitrificans]